MASDPAAQQVNQTEEEKKLSPQQKQGIFKTLQNWFNSLGFYDAEITSIDPRLLQISDTDRTGDPFAQQGLRTLGGYAPSWRQKDDIEDEEDKSGFLARDNRYRDYKQMVKEPEIDSALSTYADEGSQIDEHGHTIKIVSNSSRLKDMVERLFFTKLRIDKRIWDILFEVCWMGDSFWEICLDRETQKEILKIKRIKPDHVERVEKDGKLEKFMVRGHEIDPLRIVHFRNRSIRFGEYGASVLEAGRAIWKQLKMLEDAVVVYRVTRAPERKIFYVDVGQLSPPEADQAIERFKQRFQKKKMLDITTGRIDTVTNVMSYNESYYIPRITGRTNSELTTLGGATPNAGELDDLAYFKDKLMAMLRIPRDFASYNGGATSSSGITTAKYLSEQDIRFSRVIGRVQENIVEGLKKIAIVYLLLNGVSPEETEQFEIRMTKASAIEEMRRIETQNSMFGMIQGVKGLNMVPDVWIMSKLMNMDDEEIAEVVQLMKIQRQQEAQQGGQQAAGGLGGGSPGGGVFPGEGGGGGGEGQIPPEVDQALGGQGGGAQPPGQQPAGGGEGQVAAMLNAMEASASEFEKHIDSTERDRIKRSALKRRVKDRVAILQKQIREGLEVDFQSEFAEIVNGFTSEKDRLRKLAKEITGKMDTKSTIGTKMHLTESQIDEREPGVDPMLHERKWYRVLMNESVEINSMRNATGKSKFMKNLLECMDSDRVELNNASAGRNVYLKELLLEGEIKNLPKSSINLLEMIQANMAQSEYTSVLNEMVEEEKKREVKIKKRKPRKKLKKL